MRRDAVNSVAVQCFLFTTMRNPFATRPIIAMAEAENAKFQTVHLTVDKTIRDKLLLRFFKLVKTFALIVSEDHACCSLLCFNQNQKRFVINQLRTVFERAEVII